MTTLNHHRRCRYPVARSLSRHVGISAPAFSRRMPPSPARESSCRSPCRSTIRRCCWTCPPDIDRNLCLAETHLHLHISTKFILPMLQETSKETYQIHWHRCCRDDEGQVPQKIQWQAGASIPPNGNDANFPSPSLPLPFPSLPPRGSGGRAPSGGGPREKMEIEI